MFSCTGEFCHLRYLWVCIEIKNYNISHETCFLLISYMPVLEVWFSEMFPSHFRTSRCMLNFHCSSLNIKQSYKCHWVLSISSIRRWKWKSIDLYFLSNCKDLENYGGSGICISCWCSCLRLQNYTTVLFIVILQLNLCLVPIKSCIEKPLIYG